MRDLLHGLSHRQLQQEGGRERKQVMDSERGSEGGSGGLMRENNLKTKLVLTGMQLRFPCQQAFFSVG